MGNKNESVKADKTMAATKNVMENIDLVGLEQQLLMDQAATFKKKQLRDLKMQMDAKSKVQEDVNVVVKKSDDKKSDDVDQNNQKNGNVQQMQVVDDGDVNVEIVNGNEDDKDVKDMLDNPVDNGKNDANQS